MTSELTHLLGLYVGTTDASETALSDAQWEDVFLQAKNHSLLGILYQIVQMLPADRMPPKKCKMQIAYAGEKITARNGKMNGLCGRITDEIHGMGLECCVLKGQGIAKLYPYPQTRASGDIDLWVRGSAENTLKVISQKWKLHDVLYHHAGIYPFGDRTEVEIHFHPTWMNNPLANRKLQNYYDTVSGRQFSRSIGTDGFSTPDMEFNCVMEVTHICSHLLREGIGLRQVMDMYYILKHSSSDERKSAARVLSSLGIGRFTSALMYVLAQWFSLGEDCFLFPADKRYGEFLGREILLSGNFGRSDTRFSYDVSAPLPRRAAARLRRLSHCFSLAPSEVLWAPVFKLWQKGWKRKMEA